MIHDGLISMRLDGIKLDALKGMIPNLSTLLRDI